MARKTTLRLSATVYAALRKAFAEGDPRDEKFAFVFGSRARGDNTDLHLGSGHLLPGPRDLARQGPGGVEPSREFQTLAYGLAEDLGVDVFDVHTHPFQKIPRFSSIDHRESERNADFVLTFLQRQHDVENNRRPEVVQWLQEFRKDKRQAAYHFWYEIHMGAHESLREF